MSCQAPGFNPFFGTSAAAPHAGAIAALVKSADHALTRTQVTHVLTPTAIDIEGAGVDRDSGAGILDAFAAVQAVGAVPHAFVALDSLTISEGARSNGNSAVEPGESALQDLFARDKSLREVNAQTIPTRCIPVHLKRYLYARSAEGSPQLLRDRYEFLVYQLLRAA